MSPPAHAPGLQASPPIIHRAAPPFRLHRGESAGGRIVVIDARLRCPAAPQAELAQYSVLTPTSIYKRSTGIRALRQYCERGCTSYRELARAPGVATESICDLLASFLWLFPFVYCGALRGQLWGTRNHIVSAHLCLDAMRYVRWHCCHGRRNVSFKGLCLPSFMPGFMEPSQLRRVVTQQAAYS